MVGDIKVVGLLLKCYRFELQRFTFFTTLNYLKCDYLHSGSTKFITFTKSVKTIIFLRYCLIVSCLVVAHQIVVHISFTIEIGIVLISRPFLSKNFGRDKYVVISSEQKSEIMRPEGPAQQNFRSQDQKLPWHLSPTPYPSQDLAGRITRSAATDQGTSLIIKQL